MSYQTLLYAEQRLAILQVLDHAGNYALNTCILQKILKQLGLGLSYETLLSHLNFLENKNLIKTDHLESIKVCALTHAGLDVAQGLAAIAGIARLTP